MINKYNRVQKTAPKLGKMWCIGCDAAFVAVGSRCPVCGLKYKTKHKKP